MIKFFRHIRKSLLMENKTSKYFKYAIGEIILVVIGILIALQINNWNENLKKESIKKSYVTSLINDLKKDTVQLNERLKNNNNLLANIDSISAYLDSTSLNAKQLYNHLQNRATFFGLRVTNTYNINTFNILTSSGNIDLFSNHFTNELMELNRLQLSEIKVSEGNSNHFFNSLTFFRNNYFGTSTIHNEALKKSLMSDDIPKKYVSLYINLLAIQRHTVKRYLELADRVKQQTEKVIEELTNGENL